MGKLITIYLRPSRRTPVKSVESAEAVVGSGLEGDHAGSGKRQVTLLSREAWEAACAAVGAELDPGARRANLLVEGIDLADTRGRTLRVGDVELLVHGETRPCQLMDDTELGLKDALDPEWRGGVFCEVVSAGTLSVGDVVVLEAQAATG